MAKNEAKRVSMIDVAHAAGVSHQTVSRVINNSPDVSASTRIKVLRVIEQLRYYPSNSARALATKKSRTLGLIVGAENRTSRNIIAPIEAQAKSRGLFLSVSMVNETLCEQSDIQDLCESFEEQNVDGLIIDAPTDAIFTSLCRTRILKPCVCVTATHGAISAHEGMNMLRSHSNVEYSMIGINQSRAMNDIVSLIAHYGHRNAIYIAGPSQWRGAATRLIAWRSLSTAQGIHSHIVQCTSWKSSESYARMNHMIEKFGIDGIALPTVIVASSDEQAVGVVRSLYEHGLKIPNDISVVGFGDIPAISDFFPPLTTVSLDMQQLGSLAVREALRLMNHGPEPAFPDMSHGVGQIPASLKLRSSIGAVLR
ncbi:LacI family DNA-binding transcriptional regulator [Gardnerella sp. Marseille-Q9179]|uniref:LacI family DNA-binding transcriptional regulator n=1 Tax=Gardnerella sp. Marseille-Q9179 TaxID=3383028 RepID=UPI003AF94C19